jgi:hypothetical protein
VTHRIHRGGGAVLALAIALALNAAPASARTFNVNSAGSMVQQPLPPQWGCVMQRVMSGESRLFQCSESLDLNATAIRGSVVATQRPGAAAIASGRRHHRATTG